MGTLGGCPQSVFMPTELGDMLASAKHVTEVLEHALEYDIIELLRTQQVNCSDCDTSTKSGTHVL